MDLTNINRFIETRFIFDYFRVYKISIIQITCQIYLSVDLTVYQSFFISKSLSTRKHARKDIMICQNCHESCSDIRISGAVMAMPTSTRNSDRTLTILMAILMEILFQRFFVATNFVSNKFLPVNCVSKKFTARI